uniref:Polyprenal reductase n=1 Tax=Ciona intestinalis TaxID=7719 RepID=F6ZUV3_CIOIN
MLYVNYSYVLGFPVTVMNCFWVVISAIFFTTLVLNHVLAIKSKVSQFLAQYGKAKSIHVDFDIPKRWFTHFYVVASSFNLISLVSIIAGCTGSLFYMSLFSWMNIHASVTPTGDRLSLVIAVLLLTIQSLRRLYECLYVSMFSKTAKLMFVHYIWGLLYYPFVTATVVSECFPIYHLSVGYLTWKHCFGILLFIAATMIHHQSHQIFANLRKKGGVKPNSHGIPQGGLFYLVSCPHYFAELLIYISIYLVVGHMCKSFMLIL